MNKDEFRGQTALLLTVILLVMAAELMALTACGGGELQSHRLSAAMVTDGAWADWEDVPTHQVKEMNGLVLGVANDDEYLYLMARSTDLQLARQVRMLGIIARVSGQGKDGSELLVRYYGSVTLADDLVQAGGGPGGGRMPTILETGEGSGLPVPGMIEVEQNNKVTIFAENRPVGPAAGSDIAGGVYCYEFRLPLDALYAELALEGGVAGQKVRLELRRGKMTTAMRNQRIFLRNSRRETGGRGSDPRTLRVTIKLAGAV